MAVKPTIEKKSHLEVVDETNPYLNPKKSIWIWNPLHGSSDDRRPTSWTSRAFRIFRHPTETIFFCGAPLAVIAMGKRMV